MTAAAGNLGFFTVSVIGLWVLALVASVPIPLRHRRSWQPVAEALAVVILATTPQPPVGTLLPYLLVPGFAAGIRYGSRSALVTASASLVVGLSLILRPSLVGIGSGLEDIIQWSVLAFVFGLFGGWFRSTAQLDPGEAVAEAYNEAARLLVELRSVSRRLPGGLDTAGLAQGLLAGAAERLPVLDGAVHTGETPDTYTAVASLHSVLPSWAGSAAWASLVDELDRNPGVVVLPGGFGGGDAVRAGCSLRAGERVIGVITLELANAPSSAQRKELLRLTQGAALQIHAALLFSDVRDVATVEERRRLAREIHDGVAQEIAALGYAVDELEAEVDRPEEQEMARHVRDELTRVVTELRLSIFDLRTDPSSASSLGAAITAYAREVGSSNGLVVKTSLDESPERLRPQVEAELLRIVQEAVQNARRHSGASTLWLDCSIAPPAAQISVADDGRGIGSPRPDRFGMAIMRERADRIGARLTIGGREGGGTVVTVALGPDRDTPAGKVE